MSFGYGKLILFGEYAVLEGEPALVVGTEFKAQASWTALDQVSSYLLTSGLSIFIFLLFFCNF